MELIKEEREYIEVNGKHDDKRSKTKRIGVFQQLPLMMHLILFVWCYAIEEY
jgi:hypothetical protein